MSDYSEELFEKLESAWIDTLNQCHELRCKKGNELVEPVGLLVSGSHELA